MNRQPTMVSLAREYLEFRRKLGFQLKSEGALLMQFARYADDCGHRGPLTEELALRWAQLPQKASPLYRARRLEVVRCFARHRAIFDPECRVPAKGLLGPAHRRTAPHIHSPEEMTALLKATRRLSPAGGLRPATYTTLFSLLACTGLRISEALKLTRSDVDWKRGTLTIRQTKFHKTRLVPLHDSATRALGAYARLRDRRVPAPAGDTFFVTMRGDRLCYSTVRTVFRKLCNRVCPSQTRAGRAPRLHDFRHNADCRIMPIEHRRSASSMRFLWMTRHNSGVLSVVGIHFNQKREDTCSRTFSPIARLPNASGPVRSAFTWTPSSLPSANWGTPVRPCKPGCGF